VVYIDDASKHPTPVVIPWPTNLDCACTAAAVDHVGAAVIALVPMIDWISDPILRPQGYTGLQSPVECLDHRYGGRYSIQSCKAVSGCTMH